MIATPQKVLAVLPGEPPGLEPGEIARRVGRPRPTVSTACQRLFSTQAIRRGDRDRRGRWRYWLPIRGVQAQVEPEQG